MTLKLDIISPKETVLSTEAKEVILPTKMGEVGLLNGHVPLITELELGLLKLINDVDEQVYVIKGGYAQVISDTVSILTDEALKSIDIDGTNLKLQINTLEEQLAAVENSTDAFSENQTKRIRDSLSFCQLQESLLDHRR